MIKEETIQVKRTYCDNCGELLSNKSCYHSRFVMDAGEKHEIHFCDEDCGKELDEKMIVNFVKQQDESNGQTGGWQPLQKLCH